MSDPLARLEAIVDARMNAGEAAMSYVAKLAAAGVPKIAQKVGEEAVESVIAALQENPAALAGEAADLLFHFTVLLRVKGMSWGDVAAVLKERERQSGLDEKASRKV